LGTGRKWENPDLEKIEGTRGGGNTVLDDGRTTDRGPEKKQGIFHLSSGPNGKVINITTAVGSGEAQTEEDERIFMSSGLDRQIKLVGKRSIHRRRRILEKRSGTMKGNGGIDEPLGYNLVKIGNGRPILEGDE